MGNIILLMPQQGRWPTNGETKPEFEHKLGECIWWVIILAKRMNIHISEVVEKFLSKTEKHLAD